MIELKACFEPTDMPTGGTRFVAHKVATLERLINRFGAYLNHLAILSEDPTVKSTNRQKFNPLPTVTHDCEVT